MMRNTRRPVLLAALALACFALLGAGSPGQDGPKPVEPKKRIAVIPKGTTHVFWKTVEAGVKKAGEDLGVEIIWKGPLQENDRAQQIQLVQQFTTQGVDGIVLAPLDFKALVAPVKAAAGKKIPTVVFDSALEGEAPKDFVSFVATDSAKAGGLGGEHLVKLTAGHKDAGCIVLRYLAGSASTDARESGAITALRNAANVKIISDKRYGGATSGEAKTAALNMADDLKKVAESGGGVFCPNESTTMGMLLALRQLNLIGKVKFVGFDASPPLVEALKKGEIDALVVQDPRNMGYKAVEAMVKTLKGETVETRIDTGAVLVTKANMDQPEIKRLIE